MPKPELPNILDLCPTCGSPKPCSLHDEEFLKNLLESEHEPLPDFEKTETFDYPDRVTSIGRLSETKILVGGYSGDIRLVDLAKSPPSQKHIAWYPDSTASADILDIIPLSATKALVVGDGCKVISVDISTDPPKQELVAEDRFTNLGGSSVSAAEIENGEIVVFDFNGKVKSYQPSIGQQVESYGTINGNASCLSKVSESKILLGGNNGSIYLLDIKNNSQPLKYVASYEKEVSDIAVLSEIKAIVVGVSGDIRLLDLSTEPPSLTTVGSYGREIQSVYAVSETKVIVGGDGGSIQMLDLSKDPPEISEIANAEDDISSVCAVSDSRILVGLGLGDFQLWEIPEEKLREYHERQIEEEKIPEMPE